MAVMYADYFDSFGRLEVAVETRLNRELRKEGYSCSSVHIFKADKGDNADFICRFSASCDPREEIYLTSYIEGLHFTVSVIASIPCDDKCEDYCFAYDVKNIKHDVTVKNEDGTFRLAFFAKLEETATKAKTE